MEITEEKETVVLWDLDENQEIFHVEEIIDLKSKPFLPSSAAATSQSRKKRT